MGARQLSGVRKGAILLQTLDAADAAEVLRRLPAESVSAITREIAAGGDAPAVVRTQVYREFFQLIAGDAESPRTSQMEDAQNRIRSTLAAGESEQAIRQVSEPVGRRPFDFLGSVEVQELLPILANEHPQTIALVLTNTPSDLASQVLQGLAQPQQIEVIRRLAAMEIASPEAVAEVEQALRTQLVGNTGGLDASRGGVERLAEILNFDGRSTEREILGPLGDDDPHLVDSIRRSQVSFEDLAIADDACLQAIVESVELHGLATSLRTASDAVKRRLFDAIPPLAASQLRQEMQYMGPVRVSDAEAAQQQVLHAARRLEDAGLIVLPGRWTPEGW